MIDFFIPNTSSSCRSNPGRHSHSPRSGWSCCWTHIWLSPHSSSLLTRQTVLTVLREEAPPAESEAASDGEHLGTTEERATRRVKIGCFILFSFAPKFFALRCESGLSLNVDSM